ncbi:hypothetical protein ABXV23_10920 [Vibrio owensii]
MIAKIYGKWLKQANKHESECVWKELDKAKERMKIPSNVYEDKYKSKPFINLIQKVSHKSMGPFSG